MIDIHSHVIPFLDDGSKTLDASLKMLEEEKRQSVTDVICTPHFRAGVYEQSVPETERCFRMLVSAADGIGINLYLGQEIAVTKSVAKSLNEGVRLTLAGSKYALLEFDYNNYVDISEIVYDMRIMGYSAVIAHIERYSYLKISDVEEIIDTGGYVQINAESLFLNGRARRYKKICLDLLKRNLVDFVASDIHIGRINKMADAYSLINKKFGREQATQIFEKNPRAILENKEIR